MKLRPLASVAALALTLAACASAPQAQVTRFHLGQPIARATIALVPQLPAMSGTLEFQSYADAVAAELRAQGFTPVASPMQAELTGLLDVQRTYRPGGSRGPSFSIGLGGATFGRHTGIGGGVSIPVASAKPTDIAVTSLALQMKRRSDGTIIWEGRALGEAKVGSAAASPTATVTTLARAMLAGFPGPSGQTVKVKL